MSFRDRGSTRRGDVMSAVLEVGLIDIPEGFAASTLVREGEGASAWLAALPGVVASFLDRWELVAEGPVWYGQVGIALPVTRADGSAAVLKVSWLDGSGAEP